jgi:DNA gyrase subunit A
MDQQQASAPAPTSLVKPILVEEELKQSFLEYAMSVVVSRAIPDVRDGLKPVHRRVLYTMHQLGFHYNKPYHKSVRVVGEVLGKYHPHGDQAVYNTMVGLVQDFSKRYPLLDGQGNWGSVDGDNAAAMRYTEVRMQRITQEILSDIDRETVGFVPNFDGSTVEPVVLPSRLPNLLVNGTAGIAVGMATSIPPHNLGEVLNACRAYLKNDQLTDEELFSLIPGPDFPTGGIICGRAGILKAYQTGRGSGTNLVVTQLPYQVIKADLAIKVAELVRTKVIDGITGIRDESNKKGIRLVFELRRNEDPYVILNQLYKHTNLQTNVPILMLALLDNQPIVFTLRHMIREFLAHREEVVYRRTQFDLRKAQAREHIVSGFLIALGSIDEVIELLKSSRTTEEACLKLNQRFLLSEEQSKAILDMRLQRLTGMEQDKLHAEMEELKKTIIQLRSIIEDRAMLKSEIVRELDELQAAYADERKTQIQGAVDILSEADLIPDDAVVVTLTSKGYIKRVPLETYNVQHRGGRGKMGLADLEDSEDYVQDIFVTRNHDDLLFFTNLGRVYSLTVFEIPEASRTARGRAIVNMLPLTPGEQVVKLLCTREFEDRYLVMLTRKGIVKRTHATLFSKIRKTGIRAITVAEGDDLIFCSLSTGNDSIVIATAKGQGIHFKETEVRSMGREAAGVIGIRLGKSDHVVGMQVVKENDEILFATSRGYGKRVRAGDFRVAHRGGLGVRTIPTDSRNGQVIGLVVVSELTDVLLIENSGKIIRLTPKEVRTMGRQAKGVRLIKLDDTHHLVGIAACMAEAPERLEAPPSAPASHEMSQALEEATDEGESFAPDEFASLDADEQELTSDDGEEIQE